MTIYTITYVILFIYEAEVEHQAPPLPHWRYISAYLFIVSLIVIGCFSTIALLSSIWLNWNIW